VASCSPCITDAAPCGALQRAILRQGRFRGESRFVAQFITLFSDMRAAKHFELTTFCFTCPYDPISKLFTA